MNAEIIERALIRSEEWKIAFHIGDTVKLVRALGVYEPVLPIGVTGTLERIDTHGLQCIAHRPFAVRFDLSGHDLTMHDLYPQSVSTERVDSILRSVAPEFLSVIDPGNGATYAERYAERIDQIGIIRPVGMPSAIRRFKHQAPAGFWREYAAVNGSTVFYWWTIQIDNPELYIAPLRMAASALHSGTWVGITDTGEILITVDAEPDESALTDFIQPIILSTIAQVQP